MSTNAAIYLPVENPDLTKVFPEAKSDSGLFKRQPSKYQLAVNGAQAVFNVMPGQGVAAHIESLLRYIDTLNDDAQRKADAAMVLRQTRSVLGLVSSQSFEENEGLWQALFKIADAFDGYVFVHGSLLLPSGAVIVGPLRQT